MSFASQSNPPVCVSYFDNAWGDLFSVSLTFRPRRAGATAQVSLGSVALQGISGLALPHEGPSSFRTSIQ